MSDQKSKDRLEHVANVLRRGKDLGAKAVVILATHEIGQFTVGHSADETLPPKERSDICMAMMLSATASMMKYVVGADLLVRCSDGTIVEINENANKPADLSKILH